MQWTPRWMPIWPDEPKQREIEIRAVVASGFSRRTATYWYFLRKLGPSAEYDLTPNDNALVRMIR
jgi:hypothetical protein